ncbi:MAG: hypothetical protein QOH63_3142 [Acidobacteriota bacterium]|jgi:hypothetical protein|nr:hypothetical protein [Acidobacteriota bacterium]
MRGATKHNRRRGAAWWTTLVLAFVMAGCGGSLYKVKPKVDAPVTGGKEASAGGFNVRAVPLVTDEESQELFEANLPLGGLLPVRLEMSNESGATLSFKRVRFHLRDSDGREWKLRSPKQVVSRILDSDKIYLYNPNSRKKFEEALGEHAFETATPLDAGKQRRGLIFFQTPKKEQINSPRGLVLTIEGLPQPVEVIFN